MHSYRKSILNKTFVKHVAIFKINYHNIFVFAEMFRRYNIVIIVIVKIMQYFKLG